MNTRTAVSLIIISSLAVLLTGCAGGTGQAGREDAAMGLARGSVIVKDDLSPTRGQQRSFEPQAQAAPPWSTDVLRELKGSAPLIVEQSFSAEVWRELKSEPVVVEQQFSADVWRELKGSTAGTQPDMPRVDDLSPIGGGG